MQNRSKIIVILGMHRSGTSLVANFLHALGVDFGQNLLPADERNAGGYWESRTIREIQDQILTILNCQWHNPPLFFPSNWQNDPRIRKLRRDLLEFVRLECQRTENTWGFKDPRTAILLPMWQEIFDELHLEPYYVLSVRHPEAVAASLQKRDRVDVSHAQAIWLKTNLEIMSHLGNKLRSVVDYDRWFDSGLDQGRALANSLQLIQPPDETLLAEAIDRVIRPGLRHHYGNQEVICSPTVEKFYFLLRHAAIDGKIPDEVAQILSTFEKSLDLLNIWDTLVVERDAIIAQNDLKIRRMKKQKNVLLYLVFALPALILALSAFFAWRFWH